MQISNKTNTMCLFRKPQQTTIKWFELFLNEGEVITPTLNNPFLYTPTNPMDLQ